MPYSAGSSTSSRSRLTVTLLGHLRRRTRGRAAADGASPVAPGEARRFLRDQERSALRRGGLVRLGVAALLLGAISLASRGLPATEVATLRQIEAGQVFVLVFGLMGLGIYLLARRGIATRILPYVTVTVDAVLVLGNLAYNHWASEIPGNYTFVFPVVWLVPIALAGNAIYYRTGLQVFATAIYLVGLPAISFLAGYLPAAERRVAQQQLESTLSGPPNAVRLTMILAIGVVLILAARQGRRLLERAVRETTLRLNLTRYLPGELAPVLSEDAFAGLRAGRRIDAVLLFVDIRGSSALGAAMDPADLARFITAFRRRVGQASARHGGLIDKFVGDGALVVFGMPEPTGTDAARALGCARTLLDLLAAWNAEEAFDPPVEVGIGVHGGEVFCGVVGEESRLEFTVLGDAVNVASRLEHATREFGVPLLASASVVAAAGEPDNAWREVSREPLPGLSQPIAILTPVDGPARHKGGPA